MLRIKPKWRDSGCIMKRRKESDEIILTCQGFSKTQVTGSCWSISYKGDDGKRHLFMIECGLPQGANTILESYNDMKRMSDKIISNGLVKSCENILFLHPHIDHTGLLPIYNSSNLFNISFCIMRMSIFIFFSMILWMNIFSCFKPSYFL